MHLRRGVCVALTVMWLAVTTVAVVGAGTGGAAPPTGWRYTMVAFSNASDRDMDVYTSSDGTTFQLLRKAAYRPPAGRVRDASIIRHSDGWYYITYTTIDGANIGFARSRDRLGWTHIGNWPVPLCCALLPGTGDGRGLGSSSGPGSSGSSGSSGSIGSSDLPSLSPFTTKAWAPEFFVDGGQVNIILSMSTGGGFVPYLMTALDPALRLWSPPVPIVGIGADHIDTTVVKVGATYHAFTKNETTKVIEHAVAPSLVGPYRFVPIRNWGRFVEGPVLTQLPNGAWRIYLDAYKSGRYLYSDSTDGLRTWSRPATVPRLSGTVRHVGVVREQVP